MRTREHRSVVAPFVLSFVCIVWGVSGRASWLSAAWSAPRDRAMSLSTVVAPKVQACIGRGSIDADPVGGPEFSIAEQTSAPSTGANVAPDGVNKIPAGKGTKNGTSPSKAVPESVGVAAEASGKPVDHSIDINGYVIGEEDLLTITVWKEKDLSGGVVVRPDGKITISLVGDVKVSGLTTQQVQALLTEKLKPFVEVPQVTVAVSQINSRKVYLIGQVSKEGTFPLNGSTTVLQILTQAGGLKDFAKRKSIYILRQSGGQQVRYSFNYDAVVRGKKQEQNIFLQPGDTIVVP